jgi:hypothetical protein
MGAAVSSPSVRLLCRSRQGLVGPIGPTSGSARSPQTSGSSSTPGNALRSTCAARSCTTGFGGIGRGRGAGSTQWVFQPSCCHDMLKYVRSALRTRQGLQHVSRMAPHGSRMACTSRAIEAGSTCLLGAGVAFALHDNLVPGLRYTITTEGTTYIRKLTIRVQFAMSMVGVGTATARVRHASTARPGCDRGRTGLDTSSYSRCTWYNHKIAFFHPREWAPHLLQAQVQPPTPSEQGYNPHAAASPATTRRRLVS